MRTSEDPSCDTPIFWEYVPVILPLSATTVTFTISGTLLNEMRPNPSVIPLSRYWPDVPTETTSTGVRVNGVASWSTTTSTSRPVAGMVGLASALEYSFFGFFGSVFPGSEDLGATPPRGPAAWVMVAMDASAMHKASGTTAATRRPKSFLECGMWADPPD
jgi:hypothetical protein